MKRSLWLACMSGLCALSLVACGDDDDGSSGGEDGGVSNFPQVEERLDQVDEDLADLTTDVSEVSDGLGKANTAIDGVDTKADGLDKRIDAIEGDLAAPPGKCSEDEVCMSDGVAIAEGGIAKIVEQLCTLEINCCSEDERSLKFGPGITTVAECTQTFTDLVQNGFTPAFLNNNAVLVNMVLNIAQAINSNDVQVSIDAAAVDACVAHLGMRECPKYVAPGAVPTHCEPLDRVEVDDPCAIKKLVKGGQELGDVCGITGIDECATGLVCRKTGIGGSLLGLCSNPSAVGDRCRTDDDCDGSEQFCNLGTGKCQDRSGEGGDCEYVDPTFFNAGFNLDPDFGFGASGLWQNPDALKVECKAGLTCDPTTKKCVNYCSTGSICSTNAQCPDGKICNLSKVANLYDSFGLGTCGDPVALGEACNCNGTFQANGDCTDGPSKECASMRCAYDSVTDNRFECTAPLKAAGEACSLTTAGVSQTDPTCASNRCGTDAKCTAECSKQSDCPNTHYCTNTDVMAGGVPAWREPTNAGKFACEPKKANDAACSADFDADRYNDLMCATGNCDSTVAQCKAKVAVAGACPAGQHSACTNAFCKSDGQAAPMYFCTAFVAAGGTCAGAVVGDPDCGPGAYCGGAGSNANKCVTYVASGGTCDATNDVDCNASAALVCVTVGAGTQCHEPGKYPIGAACNGGPQLDAMGLSHFGDSFCNSTWCRASDGTCQAPLAAGIACDDDDPAKNRCAAGTYCRFPNLPMSASAYGEGTCTAQGTAGQSCDPRFGNDCATPGFCTLRNDAFVCSEGALVKETLFCDGE